LFPLFFFGEGAGITIVRTARSGNVGAQREFGAPREQRGWNSAPRNQFSRNDSNGSTRGCNADGGDRGGRGYGGNKYVICSLKSNASGWYLPNDPACDVRMAVCNRVLTRALFTFCRDWFAVAPRDQRIEAQLFGAQLSGINFDKYEDIPVETSGNDCPQGIDSVCIESFASSPIWPSLEFR
jgi:hypothetical protein